MDLYVKAYGQLGQDAGRLKRTGIRAFGAFGGGREPKALDQYYIDQTVRHDEYVKGHEKGIKKGIEQGKQDTARNMKRKGIPLEIIAECTGLSLEEIERL